MFGFGRKKLKQTAVSEDGQPSGGEESPAAKEGIFKRLFGARDGEDLGWVPGLGPLPEAGGAPTALPGGAVAPVAQTVPETPVECEAAPEPERAFAPAPEPTPGPAPRAESGESPGPSVGLLKRIFHRTDEVPDAPPAARLESAPPDPAARPPKPPYALKIIPIRDQPVDWELPEVRQGLFSRLRERLSRSRTQLGSGLGNLFLGRKKIDDELMEELETLLLTADVGIDATARVIDDLTRRVKRKALADPQALLAALKEALRQILIAAAAPVRQAAPDRPQVVLMVGVNGAGKTTTIGKLARYLQADGNSIMLAAGDTFRAAAVEQLQAWGERNRVPVIAQKGGADSASVIFDALQAATARGVDVLIADTAGRLHTKTNLMDELTKIARVMRKIDPQAPHEVLLVVDATTGQNGLNQAVQFHQAVPLTGIALTKLDGTAKGGIVFAIAEKLKVPIRFIGVGESIEDLRPFDADEFLDALLGQ
jgi:fused signal recognition particle receptor|nr:signal recognition particle-docking protein FtsY [Candidatus Thiodictyon syntrophicum]